MRTQLNEALKQAMKAKAPRRTSTLRLILAAIKDRDIAARSEDRCEGVSDDEILQILAKMVRQRHEAADTFEQAGRIDLALKEREEITIIEEFLPRQLGGDEIRAACETVIAEVGATGLRDMGRCMALLKERFAGRMDFGQASMIVRETLSRAS